MNTSKAASLRADSLLTSYQVGALLQVNPSSVNKWVKDGRIPAFRTPGGHRRIRAGDLVLFLQEHQMPVPDDLSEAARQRLLIVDTNPREVERAIKTMGPLAERLEIATVEQGIDALIKVGSFCPNMVVLSAQLSDMDGIDICRKLTGGTLGITVVVIGDGSETTAQSAKAAGASACLTRPINPSNLATALSLGDSEPAA